MKLTNLSLVSILYRPSSFCSLSIKFEYQNLQNLSRMNSGIQQRSHRVYKVSLICSSTLLCETLQILLSNPMIPFSVPLPPISRHRQHHHQMENLQLPNPSVMSSPSYLQLMVVLPLPLLHHRQQVQNICVLRTGHITLCWLLRRY